MTKSRREVYGVDEIKRVLSACPDTPTGARDRFAVMLLWSTGLKTSELLSLRMRDWSKSVVKVGGRKIVVPIAQRDRLEALRNVWVDYRRGVANRQSPLLCNLTGGPLDSSYVRHMLASLSKEAGLGKRINAQGFRNTFAAAMHCAGVSMETIQRQLGLDDLTYTAGYVALIASDQRPTPFILE